MNHPKEMVICFDVDDTLLMWNTQIKDVYVDDPYGVEGAQIPLKRHEKHIKLLKDHKARGYYVIVWSAGGYAWAKAAVRALQLDLYVDDILAKPIKFVDDLQAEEVLTNRIYLSDSKENS